MSIATYSELNTAVANWLDRDDLTDRIPEFIALCEARFNRLLRIRAMEYKQTASTVAAQRNLALPAGFIQMRNLQMNETPIVPMQYVTPEIYDRLYGSTSTGTPEMYTIIADEMQNATPNQMKMLLTRVGEGTKLVITGDLEQSDLGEENGLRNLIYKMQCQELEYITHVEMGAKDIVRHPVVNEVLKVLNS
jgi:hypothetical protein